MTESGAAVATTTRRKSSGCASSDIPLNLTTDGAVGCVPPPNRVVDRVTTETSKASTIHHYGPFPQSSMSRLVARTSCMFANGGSISSLLPGGSGVPVGSYQLPRFSPLVQAIHTVHKYKRPPNKVLLPPGMRAPNNHAVAAITPSSGAPRPDLDVPDPWSIL